MSLYSTYQSFRKVMAMVGFLLFVLFVLLGPLAARHGVDSRDLGDWRPRNS